MSAILTALALAAASTTSIEGQPKTLVLDGPGMARLREQIKAGKSNVAPALELLREQAGAALKRGPWTVTAKKLVPPSGDTHDYMSVGPYWWPDPKKPDGLPYIRRDGEVNPERNGYDNVGLSRTAGNSLTLALAWYYTGEASYAEHAAVLLRAWFLAPSTRMNPNLNYGQAIPGRCEGRGIGIIDTGCLIRAVDAALILELSPAWSAEDAAGLRTWFGEYLSWLQKSKNGRDEARTKNNHGTWYDAQIAAFAIYSNRPEVARKVLEDAKKRRIASQIKPDGKQPHELARTKSWSYSVMNLSGFLTLATLGGHVGVDLWNYRPEPGGGIRAALDWMIPFAKHDLKWQYKQLGSFKGGALAGQLRQAANAYKAPDYEALLPRVLAPEKLAKERFQLTHPPGD